MGKERSLLNENAVFCMMKFQVQFLAFQSRSGKAVLPDISVSIVNYWAELASQLRQYKTSSYIPVPFSFSS